MYLLCEIRPRREILAQVGHMFGNSNWPYITHVMARAYLDALKNLEGPCDLHEFWGWLEQAAQLDPKEALATAEIMLVLLNRSNPPHIWPKEPLLAALASILREADESDNDEFIKRAVALQDHLLQLDVNGIEELYELAARV